MYRYILFCFCLLACRKATVNTVNTDNPVSIKLDECATVQRSSEIFKVCLDSLNDSRCPLGALCIWTGVATVKLTVTGHAVHSFLLSTLKRPSFPPADTTIENHRIQLTKVLPYPGEINNGSSRIEVQVN